LTPYEVFSNKRAHFPRDGALENRVAFLFDRDPSPRFQRLVAASTEVAIDFLKERCEITDGGGGCFWFAIDIEHIDKERIAALQAFCEKQLGEDGIFRRLSVVHIACVHRKSGLRFHIGRTKNDRQR
jgi:hypothetical protein